MALVDDLIVVAVENILPPSLPRVHKIVFPASDPRAFLTAVNQEFGIPTDQISCCYLDGEEVDFNNGKHMELLRSMAIFRMRHHGSCLPVQVRASTTEWVHLVEEGGKIVHAATLSSISSHSTNPRRKSSKVTINPVPLTRAVTNASIIIDVDSEMRKNNAQQQMALAKLETSYSMRDKHTSDSEEASSYRQDENDDDRRTTRSEFDDTSSMTFSSMFADDIEEEPEEDEKMTQNHDCLWWLRSDHPLCSAADAISMLVILVSVASFCFGTLPQYRLDENGDERTSDHPTFFAIETACIVWFTLEYLMRLFAAENRLRKWIWQPLNLIDLIAILPYYIGLLAGSSGASSLAVIRILRLLRVSRLFKFSRHSQGLQDLMRCLAQTQKELALFFLIITIGVILAASAVFYCEKDEEDTLFISIPAALWWAVITLTTVGYGDMYPITVQGRIVGGFIASLGVVLIAIPAGIFISEFMRLHNEQQLVEKKRVSHRKAMAELQKQLEQVYEKLEEYNLARDASDRKFRLKFADCVKLVRQHVPPEDWPKFAVLDKEKRKRLPTPQSELHHSTLLH
eukprot:m.68295 g.68295  ORF g.68295 m.68295 type:complete len:570 (+) comp13677_c0_seq1:280-1989(+)